MNFGLSSDRTYNLMDLGNKSRLSTRLGQLNGPMIPTQSNKRVTVDKASDQEGLTRENSLDNLLTSTDNDGELQHDIDVDCMPVSQKLSPVSQKLSTDKNMEKKSFNNIKVSVERNTQNQDVSKMTDLEEFSSDIKLVEHLKSHFGLSDDRKYDTISPSDKAWIGMRLAAVLWQLSNGDIVTLMQGILSRHVHR